jgi:hypothetical protein
MMRTLTVATALLLVACSQQPAEAPPANQAASAPEPKAAAEVPALQGEWQVATIDGKPVGEGSAMSVSFARTQASLIAGCVRRAFAYTQKRNVVSFAASPGGSSNCEGQGASAQLATAADALQNASIVIFDKAGSEANLSGTGGNLTIRRR